MHGGQRDRFSANWEMVSLHALEMKKSIELTLVTEKKNTLDITGCRNEISNVKNYELRKTGSFFSTCF